MLTVLLALLFGQPDAGVQDFAARMRAPNSREAAACQALASTQAADLDATCQVNHSIETTGPGRQPVFVVFFAHGWEGEGRHQPVGHFEVFDHQGRHLAWFANANVLTSDDRIVSVPGRPAMVFFHLEHQVGCQEDEHLARVNVVYVVSLASPARPLLSLIVGPPTVETHVVGTVREDACSENCSGDVCSVFCSNDTGYAPSFTWSASVSCRENRCELGIGPTERRAHDKPAAVYRWNMGGRRIDGPSGDVGGDFFRFTEETNSALAIQKFGSAHGFSNACKTTR